LDLTHPLRRSRTEGNAARPLHGLVQGDAPGRATAGAATHAEASSRRVRLDGKFFRLGDEKFWVKGVTYGPFAPQPGTGVALPQQHALDTALRLTRCLGANPLRVYHVPPRDFLDTAQAFGLKVLVDVPWSKHRCFLESREDQESGRRAVREAARVCREHPA